MDFLERTELLIGKESVEKLKSSKVAVFGIGGVGSYVAEALGRCGIGNMVLIDYDIINKTNINRQIHSTVKTIGQNKVQVMAERLKEINPCIKVEAHKREYKGEADEELLSNSYDYVVDAIDSVPAKISLIVNCINKKIPIISSMGAGFKLDPTKFKVADIYETNTCPLARIMRHELKKRGVKSLKVVYSTEKPISIKNTNKRNNRQIGSISFVPAAAGLVIASVVVKDLISIVDSL